MYSLLGSWINLRSHSNPKLAIHSGALYFVPAVQSNVKPTPTRLDVRLNFSLANFMSFSCFGNPKENQTISGFSLIISSKYFVLQALQNLKKVDKNNL